MDRLRSLLLFGLVGFLGLFVVEGVKAEYINLCGSGTAASFYDCPASCNINNRSCSGSGAVVVKYTCSGRNVDCRGNESGWASSQSVGNPGCDKSVQIDVFDKKCRKSDGGWDPNCTLLGYIVWYSGACAYPTATLYPTATPRPTATPTPTLRPTITPTASPTPSGTPTPTPTLTPTPTVTPTPAPGEPNACGGTCGSNANCQGGYFCYFPDPSKPREGFCRNPSCPAKTDCLCQVLGVATTPTATPAPVAKAMPKAGVGGSLATTLMWGGVGIVGWGIKKWAKALWA
jgi:hypothetical protein